MKILIILLNFMLFIKLYSAEFIVNNISSIKITDEKKLPNGMSFKSFTVKGGSILNTGKHSKNNCSGNRVDKEGEIIELNNICEFNINDGHTIWQQLKRKKSDVDAGVGELTILDGTGPYKKLTGKKCLFAVSYYEEMVFTKYKCNISDKLFEQIKQ